MKFHEIQRENPRVGARVLGSAAIVLGAAALTLAAIVVLVQTTIRVVSIGSIPLRILAGVAEIVFGTLLLLGCIYLATRLTVAVLGTGRGDLPPLPGDNSSDSSPAGQSSRN